MIKVAQSLPEGILKVALDFVKSIDPEDLQSVIELSKEHGPEGVKQYFISVAMRKLGEKKLSGLALARQGGDPII